MLAAGRIPIVVDISAQMLSPAIEGGLPINTVNRNGYIVGEDLIELLTENKAMQWQVGQNLLICLIELPIALNNL